MLFDEKTVVEDYIIKQLQTKGWRFVPAAELQRDSYAEPLLVPNLIRAIERINKDLDLTEEETNKVLNELKLAGTGSEGGKRILNLYNLGVPIKFEKAKVVERVQLFDYEDMENNDLVVSRQVNYDGRERIRTDIMLYVNGIPLVDIECKNPTSLSESWYNAYKQIKDYEELVPELYKYTQLGIAAEAKARYFPIVPWQREDVMTHEWREKDKDSIDSTVEMLAPAVLLDIIKNFLFCRVEFGATTKAVARYMQYRAANKMVGRVLAKLKGEDDKDKGLVWHWQGSGKTLTMIFAANKLYYDRALANPSIFFIVDRMELEEQLYKEFYALDMVAPEIIGTIDELKQTLSHDDYRGKRGVFITLIHKFRPEELREVYEEIKAVSQRRETIMNRQNVVAFIDEGHRTQYGTLAAQMKGILKSAFFFALTGTPIAKRGRDTYLEFSYPPEESYLDRYFITDSIRDGFTVKIVYQPRLDKEHLKKDLLQGFLEVELEELPDFAREAVEEQVKERLNPIKLFLENPRRIKAVAADIAKHYQENVGPKFKAMIVAASRDACVLYKHELDQLLPADWTAIVMTAGEREDDQLIQSHVAETRAKYGKKEMADIRKEVIERYKETELPKILIVTDMLLTGFDAPILQTLYLDKPLKEHRLLQAVARTNRPYKDLKEAGLIIDYVGILKNLKRALEMYAEEDIGHALDSYDTLRQEFIELVDAILALLVEVPRDYERETLVKAVEVISVSEANEKAFLENYKGLRKLFELLGADEIKLEYFEIFKWLSAIYVYYMKMVMARPAYTAQVADYYRKTLKFVHKSMEIEALETGLPTIEFGEDYLVKLEAKVKGKKERAANMLFTLNRLVLVERHRNPIYESLVERVEKLMELWQDKTKDYETIYKQAAGLIGDATDLRKRQTALEFSDLEYAVLLALEAELGQADGLGDLVTDLSGKLSAHMFPGWINQVTVKKEVEREVRRFAMGLKTKYGLSMEDMDQLYNQIIVNVRNYGAA